MHVLCLDLGTSTLKAALIDTTGRTRASAQTAIDTRHCGEDGQLTGAIEQSPAQWWQAVAEAVGALRTDGHLDADGSLPAAIALTGQMQDLVPITSSPAGAEGLPVILYSDTRATAELAELRAADSDWEARLLTTPGPDCLPAKIAWLTGHHPEAHIDALALSAAGFLGWKLTGRLTCDRLSASTTSLYDAAADAWMLPRPITESPAAAWRLPELVDPGTIGTLTPAAAGHLGFGPAAAGIPVITALGDAGAASDGIIGSAPGAAYAYLGTSGWVAHIDPQTPRPLAGSTSDFHRLVHPAGTLAIAAMVNAGSTLTWGRRVLLGISAGDEHTPSAHAAAEAALTEALAAGRWQDLTCDPALAGERTPALGTAVSTGALTGIQPATTAADLYAGLAAGIAANLGRLCAALGTDPHVPLPVTGGLTVSPGIRQILELVLDRPIVPVAEADAGLRSCARVAWEALGIEHTITPLGATA